MNYKINQKYKDRLFCFIFGNEKYKKNTLSLYNALNETSYTNEADLELTTLQDVIYIRMRNDVSFLLSNNLSLYEHQSTVNPNMPIRGFLYFGRLYDKYITTGHYNIYGSKKIELPTPRYVIFYNGTDRRPAVEKLHLSDAFGSTDSSGEFEWTATVLNLNHADNEKYLERCAMLGDYTEFVADIREYQKYMGKAEAVDRAVTEHIAKGGELAEFLLAHRAEVVDMVLTEFDEEAFVKDIYAEGLEQGLERGLRILVASLKKFVQTPQELYALIIANEDYKDLSFDEVKALW